MGEEVTCTSPLFSKKKKIKTQGLKGSKVNRADNLAELSWFLESAFQLNSGGGHLRLGLNREGSTWASAPGSSGSSLGSFEPRDSSEEA